LEEFLSRFQISRSLEHGHPPVLATMAFQDPILLFLGDTKLGCAHGLQLIGEMQLVPTFPFDLIFDPLSTVSAERTKWMLKT
jgi:hypothetical protein